MSNFLEQVPDVAKEELPELFKNYDQHSGDYLQYLESQRIERTKDIPAYKFAKSIDQNIESPVLSNIVGIFDSVADGSTFNPIELVKHYQEVDNDTRPAVHLWKKEHASEVLVKSIGVVSDMYNEIIDVPGVSDEGMVRNALLSKGYKDESVNILTKFLMKMHMYNQVFNDIESGMLEADLVKKYKGFEKVKAEVAEGGAKDPAAVAAKIGRAKWGAQRMALASAKGKPVNKVPIK